MCVRQAPAKRVRKEVTRLAVAAPTPEKKEFSIPEVRRAISPRHAYTPAAATVAPGGR